ncbi:hypothetical protein LWI29_003639 [Acer saccharum]|uniref:F-box associated beta-propeller type 3 domain-containing protein n=1 Tax=Acer saccharum TaxID=4024 RepID=A0AA39VX29_ACESA|nr:hypothetical protein LWI29_003639 [Acer saccharum]
MEYFPSEIILDILSRLPVTSVLQSKLLYSLELSALGKDDQRVNKIHVPVLPEFKVGLHRAAQIHRVTSSISGVRFGFNQTTNKYKVIKAVYRTHLRGRRILSLEAEVQILTLGSPAWRNFGRLPYHLIHQGPSQVLVCGRIHWHTWSGVRSSSPIISFDFEDEQFREVPKPDCGGLDHRPNIQLVDLGGCLSAAVYNNYREFEIWIMKEYNVKESWIKEFNIGNRVPTSLEEEDWISAQPFKD